MPTVCGNNRTAIAAREILANCLDTSDDGSLNLESHWRSNRDVTSRKIILVKILKMLEKLPRSQEYSSIWVSRGEKMALFLELMLYAKASSLYEYESMSTMKRRLEAIVVKIHVYTPPIETCSTCKVCEKRKSTDEDSNRVIKRVKKSYLSQSTFLLNNQKEMISHIYSFLDARAIATSQIVNRFAALFLTSCVEEVKIGLQALDLAGASHGSTYQFLSQYTNLRKLSITGKTKGVAPAIFSHAIHRLAQALRNGSCQNLQVLQIQQAYVDNHDDSTTTDLVDGLKNVTGLRHLDLSRNGIGDQGACAIANLMICNKMISVLTLCGNYIGEQGAFALAETISTRTSRFLSIDLIGNPIHKGCAEKLGKSFSLPHPNHPGNALHTFEHVQSKNM